MTQRGEITLSYVGFYGQTFEEFVEQASSRGFTHVQLIPDQTPNLFDQFTPYRVGDLRRALQQHGVSVSFHNVFYDINIVSVVPSVQDFALATTRSVAELARTLGASLMTVHPGYMFPGWRSDPNQTGRFWEAAKRGIRSLGVIARETGVTMCLENGSYYLSSRYSETRTPLHVGITVGEMERLLEESGHEIGVCLDVGKAQASHEPVDNFISTFSDRIRQIQIGDIDTLKMAQSLMKGILTGSPEIVFEGGQERLARFEKHLT